MKKVYVLALAAVKTTACHCNNSGKTTTAEQKTAVVGASPEGMTHFQQSSLLRRYRRVMVILTFMLPNWLFSGACFLTSASYFYIMAALPYPACVGALVKLCALFGDSLQPVVSKLACGTKQVLFKVEETPGSFAGQLPRLYSLIAVPGRLNDGTPVILPANSFNGQRFVMEYLFLAVYCPARHAVRAFKLSWLRVIPASAR